MMSCPYSYLRASAPEEEYVFTAGQRELGGAKIMIQTRFMKDSLTHRGYVLLNMVSF